jgi:ACS family hexuronate transporter-like MFS transporter
VLVQKGMFVAYEKIGQLPKAYFIMFLICGGAYLSAWLIMQVLVPKMKPIDL